MTHPPEFSEAEIEAVARAIYDARHPSYARRFDDLIYGADGFRDQARAAILALDSHREQNGLVTVDEKTVRFAKWIMDDKILVVRTAHTDKD